MLAFDPTDQKKYELVISAAKLYVKSLVLTDGLALSVASMLEKAPARYAVKKAELKSEFIPQGHMELNTTLFTENVPQRIIVGFVRSAAYTGNSRLSPFNFEHFKIREIHISANGVNYPNVSLDLSWTGTGYTRALHEMYEALGLVRTAESNGISMEKYKSGWAIFAFNLTNSQDTQPTFDLIKSGTTGIHVKFEDAVPENGIFMVVYGESQSLILLDNSRTVTTDLTV